jgi:hypothetical protein
MYSIENLEGSFHLKCKKPYSAAKDKKMAYPYLWGLPAENS